MHWDTTGVLRASWWYFGSTRAEKSLAQRSRRSFQKAITVPGRLKQVDKQKSPNGKAKGKPV